jgi:RNA polymerase sigma-70 factor (ECF subfamily)
MASTQSSGHLSTDELFRRHADFVARFLARLGVPTGQLEDALQEVFLVAHRNGGYRPGLAKPTSYLANLAIRAAARHRQRDGVARSRASGAPVEQVASDDADPARAVQVRQDLERLHRALQKLPEELCTTLVLVELEGESCVSVAAGLGCPVGTIYWRLHQARKQLRSALAASEAAPGARAPHGARAQPVRSWMIFFGLDRWNDSEASRMLELARRQPAPAMPLDALLARHHALIEASGELPAWASGVVPHAASWLTVLGGAPLVVGAVGMSAVAAGVLSLPSPERYVAPAALEARAASVEARPPSPPLHRAAKAAEAPEVRRAAAPEPQAARAPANPAASEPRPSPRGEPRRRGPDRERESAPFEAVESTPALATVPIAPPPEAPPSRDQARPADGARPAKPAKPKPDPRAPIDEATAKMSRVVSDAELAEMHDIARAERLLEDSPARALALTRAMQVGYPNSRFEEERSYLEVMALHGLGRSGEAREKAATFLRAYPAGLYSDRVRKAIAGEGR